MSDGVIIQGNNIDVLKTFPDDSVDSIVTDPPYGLSFMGKKWDYNVPTKELWSEVLRVLKPGGHLLSFGGTRTYHRLVIAIEDAGFEIRDQIQWIYGSGFPKSMNVGKQVETHKGFGTALKPANEPIVLARKPLSESTVAKNVLLHGTGALNIDGSRIGTEPRTNSGMSSLGVMHDDDWKAKPNISSTVQGRWPANVLFDEEAAAMLDEQSGVLKSGAFNEGQVQQARAPQSKGAESLRLRSALASNSGGASRFFYCAKASKSERNRGLDGMPEKPVTYMATANGTGRPSSKIDDKGKERDRFTAAHRNNHPTVKPIKLMEYLVTLITPPGGTVLDPFCGSGSTGVAAANLGFSFIGIELEVEYCKIAEKRIISLSQKKASAK